MSALAAMAPAGMRRTLAELRAQQRRSGAEGVALLWLTLLGIVLALLIVLQPTRVPLNSLLVPLIVGSLVLGPRVLPWFVVLLMTMLVVAVLLRHGEITPLTQASIAIEFLLGLLVLLVSFRRSRLGVAGFMGESMFVDLRDRILNQGGIPRLPEGWHAESSLASAGGTLFAGDFVVASNPTPDRLDVVVVDVSGKGEQAGTRALLLSGAFGGMLSALPPDGFLPAANAYLLRQGWEEGFATAVHLTVRFDTGAFEVRTAGHPPAVQRTAGDGRWKVLASEGPLLGLIEGADFTAATGTLRPGDAVLLYTDGMVEEPRRDIDLGIDRLLGEAEQLLRGDFHGAARRLVDALGSKDDDRAMVVVTRSVA
ncbi:MAG: PP2C family protein-serine/threonine phosphatase [Nocardioides sp.]